MWWVQAAYKENEPRIAQDKAGRGDILRRRIRELTAQWTRKFDVAAKKLAEYFATSVETRSREQLQRILRNGGFSVQVQNDPRHAGYQRRHRKSKRGADQNPSRSST